MHSPPPFPLLSIHQAITKNYRGGPRCKSVEIAPSANQTLPRPFIVRAYFSSVATAQVRRSLSFFLSLYNRNYIFSPRQASSNRCCHHQLLAKVRGGERGGGEELVQDLWLNNSEAGGKGGKKGRRRRRRRRRPRPILRGVFFTAPRRERERVKRRGEERPNPSSSVGSLFISQTPLLLPPFHYFLPRTLRALMEVREGPIPPPGGEKGK